MLLPLPCSTSIAGSAAALASVALAGGDDWHTDKHDAGMCAMSGVCGQRLDGDDLNCPANVAAAEADDVAASKLPTLCPTLWDSAGPPPAASQMISAFRLSPPRQRFDTKTDD